MSGLIVRAALGAAVAAASFGSAVAAEVGAPYQHTIYGIVKQIKPTQLVVQRSNGQLVTVDIAIARRTHRTGVLYVDRAVALHGDYDALHAFHAVSITGAAGIKYARGAWPQDE